MTDAIKILNCLYCPYTSVVRWQWQCNGYAKKASVKKGKAGDNIVQSLMDPVVEGIPFGQKKEGGVSSASAYFVI